MNLANKFTKSVRRHLKESALIFLIGMPAAGLFCMDCWGQVDFYFQVVPFSGLIWVLLWKGNEFISRSLDHPLPWLKAPLKRLLACLVTMTSYTVVVMMVITYLYLWVRGADPGSLSFGSALRYSGPAVIITILVATFLSAREFFLSWRELAVQNERLKRESLSSRFEALKQQVNPHFLFNSLNVLTNLVYEDADVSARFIKQLSKVYRYVLDTQGREVVPLEEELEFVRSYVFLQKMRYGDQLLVEFDLEARKNIFIAPLALQILIENAIKHNEVSVQHPLQIRVRQEEGAIIVTNTLRKRTLTPNRKPGIGLENIRSRYELLSGRPVLVQEEGGCYTVKLPELHTLA
jgi:hypothetical protein